MAFCGQCGAPLSEGTTFCGSCGKQASLAAQPVTDQPADSGGAGWTSVSSQPLAAPVSPQRPDALAWSPVANQPAQSAGWNSVPAQSAGAAPNSGQNWSPPPPDAAPVPAMSAAAGTGLTRNIAGALAYSLGIITGILFMVLEPYRRDRFVRFHAMQSILYFVFAVAFSIGWSIVVGILMNISGWVFVVAFPIRLIISLAMFGLWLYLMYQAYNDREFRIPILGAIASKQAG
ncbi:MAG: hypothetical protein WA815_20605 [Terracidiphilus sp.]